MRFVILFIVLMLPYASQAQEGSAQEINLFDDSLTVEITQRNDSILDRFTTKNDTLYKALEKAYSQNPTLRAARANLEATKEQLHQAEAGYKPKVVANADVTHTQTDTEGTSFITSDGGNTSKTASVNIDQPLFKGGSTVANIGKAKNNITAQSLALSATEQQIMYDAVEAYMNVLRDKAVLDLNQSEDTLVARELEQAQLRFDVGEVSKTDVAQAQARLAQTKSNIINAQASLAASKAVYTKLIGSTPPTNIAYPSTILTLPQTLSEAVAITETNNRDVLQAKYTNAAAEDNVNSIFGELLPQVSAVGTLSKSYDPSDFIDEQQQSAIGLSASIPLYQGGATRSRVREAKKQANGRYIEILEAINNAHADTIAAWEQLKAAQAAQAARQSQIEAARIAREGVQYESELGQRTTLDALEANQELYDAEVELIRVMRDEVVARFALGRSMGILVPQNLGFSTINP